MNESENIIERISYWAKCFGHNVPSFVLEKVEEKKRHLYNKLIIEEFEELSEASKEEDLEEIIDAYGDIVWVCIFKMVCLGYYPKHVLSDALEWGVLFRKSEKHVGKAELMPPSESLPKLVWLNSLHNNYQSHCLLAVGLNEEHSGLIEILKEISVTKSLLYEIIRLFESKGVSTMEVIESIYVSNMTKVIVGQEAKEKTIEFYQEKGIELGFNEVKNRSWTCYNLDTGKSLKSVQFKKPDHSKTINKILKR